MCVIRQKKEQIWKAVNVCVGDILFLQKRLESFHCYDFLCIRNLIHFLCIYVSIMNFVPLASVFWNVTRSTKKMKKEMVIWSTRLLCWTTSRWVETYLNDIPLLTFYAAYQVEKKVSYIEKLWTFENSMNWLKVKNICVMLKRKLLIDLGQAVYQVFTALANKFDR